MVIDQILKDYDSNEDGLISYYEYMNVRARYFWKKTTVNSLAIVCSWLMDSDKTKTPSSLAPFCHVERL